MYIYIYIYIYILRDGYERFRGSASVPPSSALEKKALARGYSHFGGRNATDLPTKIIPKKIAWLKLSRKFPTGLGIPRPRIKILLESSPLRSRILVRRLAAVWLIRSRRGPDAPLGFQKSL